MEEGSVRVRYPTKCSCRLVVAIVIAFAIDIAIVVAICLVHSACVYGAVWLYFDWQVQETLTSCTS